MKRLLLNGSPRGKESNSRLILSWVATGLAKSGIPEPPVIDIARLAERASHLQAFASADEVVFAFPLYTDSMPGVVKDFLEALATVDPAQLRGKRLAFIIQSGFPEAIHTEVLANYLARLCARMGFVHLGTIRKGGVEGIRIMPKSKIRKAEEIFARAGRELRSTGRFSDELIKTTAGRRSFGWMGRLVLRGLIRTGLVNFYWNMMLKKHGSFARRFDAPYGLAHSGPNKPRGVFDPLPSAE